MLREFQLDDGECSENCENGICDTNCLFCQFDKNLNRPKCQVCKYSGYFLPLNGIEICVENTISNCLI